MAFEYLPYLILAALSTLAGGIIAIYLKRKEIKIRNLIGFSAGILISVALFDMMPEIGLESKLAAAMLLAGFFIPYLIERVVMFHACREKECEFHTAGWPGMIGVVIESLVDGIAIVAGFAVQPLLGAVIAVAVIAHELPRGFSTAIMMRSANYSTKAVLGSVIIDSLLVFAGAGIGLLFIIPQNAIGYTLAFAAGTFLYVGAGDLLPEAHRKFDLWVILSVLIGAAIVPISILMF